MPFTPPFTFTRSSARVISPVTIPNQVNQAAKLLLTPVDDDLLAHSRFKKLLHRYKRAGWEQHYRL